MEVLAPMWREREALRPQPGESLAAYSARLEQCYRIGPFLAAQIIADLKPVAVKGCGRLAQHMPALALAANAGLIACAAGRSKRRGPHAHWHRELLTLHAETAPLLAAAGLAPLDAQNLQNCLCEFDKWERARDAGGKASRPYNPPADAKPARKPRSRKEATPIAEQQVTEQQVAEVVAAAAETIPAHILADSEQQDAATTPPPAMAPRPQQRHHQITPGHPTHQTTNVTSVIGSRSTSTLTRAAAITLASSAPRPNNFRSIIGTARNGKKARRR